MSNVVWISSDAGWLRRKAMMARKDGSMAEVFEARLDKMFAEPPAFDDAGSFAGNVQSKLNRSWATRRLVIGALGGIGGLIGVGQIVSSGVVGHMKSLIGGGGAPSLARCPGHVHRFLATFRPAACVQRAACKAGLW